MNWFNIILVLIGQALLFWYISQMYEKTSKFFNALKSLFLVISLLNIIMALFSLIIITSNEGYVAFNPFANILFIVNLLVLFVIILSYVLNYILEAVNEVNKVVK